MPDRASVFVRFLDEMALLVDAIADRLVEIDSASDENVRLARQRDLVRLSIAVTDLASAFEVSDIVAIGEALSQAASAGIPASASEPVTLLGARDTLAYLRWRLGEMRRTDSISPLSSRALVVSQILRATLASGVAEDALEASATSLGDDHLDALSPEELEIVQSFATAELRARDETLDAHVLDKASGALAREQAQLAGIYPNDHDVIPVEMKRLFVSETESDQQELSELIASYGRNPEARTQLPAMARIAHKIKGSAATLGFPEFTRLAIYFERAVLEYQRAGAISDSAIAVTLGRFLELFDTCLAAAAGLESPGSIVVEEARQLYEVAVRDTTLQDGALQSATVASPSMDARAVSGVTPFVNSAPIEDAGQSTSRETLMQVASTRLDALMVHLSALAVNRGSLAAAYARVSHAQVEMSSTIERLHEKSAQIVDAFPLASAFFSLSSALSGYSGAARTSEGTPTGPRSALSGQLRESWSNVELERFTEVDTALRALAEAVADVETLSATFSGALMQVGQLIEGQEIVSANIQQDATRMRLAPLADLTPRLEVLASYLASAFGKRVRFTIEGEMTELDRSLMRALAEPLNQLVRNAIAHGIESPDERREAGKPETGDVWIRAHYAGSEVVIEIGDDGRGVNGHALVARAISNGVLDVDEARTLSAEAALNLMFQPGVSTLDRAGALSGSGIGLDEVATLIRGVKGDIVVADTSPNGTVFRIHAPMTLTVLPALEIFVAGHVYTAPFSSVAVSMTDVAGKLHRIPRDQPPDLQDGVEPKPVAYRLSTLVDPASLRAEDAHADDSGPSETEIPAYSLAECLGLAQDEPPRSAIVVKRRDQYVGILVDAFGAARETMVRPLHTYLKRKLIRGVTIRSEDGAMALLIDISELADQLLAGAVTPPHPAPPRVSRPQPVARVLIVDDSVTIRRTLDQMLTEAGFSTALARDGYEALEMMEAELPQVVILDVEMPRLSGYELLRVMRGSPKYAQTRVAMLTSRAGAKHEQQARSLGADEYLVKPCPQDILIRVVSRLLTNSESS